MYISRYAGKEAISCDEDVPIFDTSSINVSDTLLEEDLVDLYESVGGSIIVWQRIHPDTFIRLNKELLKKGL